MIALPALPDRPFEDIRPFHELPVAVHVARRETGLLIERGRAGLATWEACRDRLVGSVLERFSTGRRLSGQGFAEVVADVRRTLSAIGPVRLHETGLAPTLGRPKGEAHEFLALLRYGCAAGGDVTGLVGLRINVSRKRFVLDQEFVGLDATRHALERAVERQFDGAASGLDEVEATLARLAGLVVVWRWGIVSHGLPGEVALPLGDGLLLGRIHRFPAEALNRLCRIDRDGLFWGEVEQNEFQVEDDAGARTFLPFLAETAIDEELMRLPQMDLRDLLRAFAARHAGLIADLGRYASWSAPELAARTGFEGVRARLDEAAGELAALLAHPAIAGTLDPAREGRPRTGSWYPQELMGPFRMRLGKLPRNIVAVSGGELLAA